MIIVSRPSLQLPQYKYWANHKPDVTAAMLQISDTKLDLTNLLPYTEYNFEIKACNYLDNEVEGCSKKAAKRSFRTKPGRPGQPKELKVVFTNATNVEIYWNTDFQVFQNAHYPSVSTKMFSSWEHRMRFPGTSRSAEPGTYGRIVRIMMLA